ncbi:MAG: FlgD immunoglobulin-like domain containing protein [Candidatus Kryptoniota bacterium]
MRYAFILSLTIAISAYAQPAKVTSTNVGGQAWQIPFASTGNTISLSVQNNSSTAAKNVSVTFRGVPSWVEFKSKSATIKNIAADSTGDAEFVFDVDKKAPVGKDTTLTATITNPDGQTWTKDIKITVGAPTTYKLYNNYPNPFNPSTKIAFELPKDSRVKLVIYDIVGREVAQVTDADYPAGYTELKWNGTNNHGPIVSSGVYFYRISAEHLDDPTSREWNKVMKMLMIK